MTKRDRQIIAAFRRIFLWSPERREILKSSLDKSKKGWYTCNICKRATEKPKVDHMIPVIDPIKGFQDWNTFINRLFCDVMFLQVLCTDCHKLKTKKENAKRKRT